MKKRFISLFTILAMLVSLLPVFELPAAAADVWDGTTAGAFAGGEGTEESPYLIATGAQLAYMRTVVEAQNSTYGKAYYKLTADIDLGGIDADGNGVSERPWTPIGTSSNPFFGTFDGGSHTITGMYVNAQTGGAGLFYYSNGIIKNLGVEGKVIGTSAGGIAVSNSYNSSQNSSGGVIERCYFKGEVEATRGNAGGIAASSIKNIRDCYVIGTVKLSDTNTLNAYVGGIVGNSDKTYLTSCYFKGSVVSLNSNAAGGMAGFVYSVIYLPLHKNCYYIQETEEANCAAEAFPNKSLRTEPAYNNADYLISDAAAFTDGTLVTKLNESHDGDVVWVQGDEYPELLPAHRHEWTYTADAAEHKITAGCTAAECPDIDGGSLTISAPENAAYNGSSHDITVTNELKTGITVAADDIKYEYKQAENGAYADTSSTVKAGYYKASLTVGTYTISVEYEIEQAVPSEDGYKNEIPKGLSGVKGSQLSEVEFEDSRFAWKTSTDKLEETGDYTAVYTPSDTNYKAVDVPVNVTVHSVVSDIEAEVNAQELADVAKELSDSDGESVTLNMTINKADNENAAKELAQAASDKSKVEYFTITLEQTATTAEGTETNELDSISSMVNIKIPLTAGNVNTTTITVYRYNSAAEVKTAVTLKEKSAAADGEEYFEVTDGYVTIHTNNFGAYAIGYDAPAATAAPRRSGGGSSRSKTTPTPTPTAAPEATEAPAETAEPSETPAETAEPSETPSPIQTETPSDDWLYTDVPETEWYYEPIKAVTDKGLMTGVWNGENADEFRPDFEISRAMFITVLYRIDGEPETSLNYAFEDILKDWYYEKAVAWGSANGIIAGYTDEVFAPDDKITREQMAAMLWRYAKYKDIDVSIGEDTNILSFNDAENITEYAIPAIGWACGADIISGYTDNTLRPQANTTRAQAAVVLDKIDDIINQ